MKKIILQSLCFLIFSFTGTVQGQDNVSLSILDIHSVSGGNVEIIASVVDENGVPIKGLGKANLELVVEGNNTKDFSVEPVSSAKSPLSVILGIDVSGSMKGVPIMEAKRSASIFLDQLDKKDFVSIMSFGSKVMFLTDFTEKKHEARAKIESLIANEQWTWLYQATYEGLDKASRAPTSRVAVVLLTDGKDEGSHRTEEEVVARIGGTQVPVYTLGFGQNAQVEYLKRIAGISRGYFLFTPNAEDLSKLYSMVIDQLKNQYLIRFSLTGPAGNYTSIVKLNYRGKVITARRGFMHFIVGPEPGRSLNPKLWLGIITLVFVIAGAVFFIANRKKQGHKQPQENGSIPEVSIMANKKINPIGFFSDTSKDFTKTVITPSQSRGEVGFEIDIPPIPFTFSLADKRNKKEYNEVIITRYDKDKEHLFSNEKVYLLFSDSSVSRPDEGREGHAKIFVDESTQTYKLEDLGSASGTRINNYGLLRNGEVWVLTDGDIVIVGHTSLQFYDKRQLTADTTF